MRRLQILSNGAKAPKKENGSFHNPDLKRLYKNAESSPKCHSRLDRESSKNKKLWIPASAGMTLDIRFSHSLFSAENTAILKIYGASAPILTILQQSVYWVFFFIYLGEM